MFIFSIDRNVNRIRYSLTIMVFALWQLSCKPSLENMEKIDSFMIVGISVETTNKNGKSAVDLGKLWERFYSENISSKILNKQSEDVYSIYTDYETDYTGKYTAIIGIKVNSLDQIPYGLIGREFNGGKYRKFTAKGKMPHAVIGTWKEIWGSDKKLDRNYTADFEVYGQKSQNGENSEVEIYIAVK